MALTGFGIWSLVFPSIISVFIRFLISFYITVWKPKLLFNTSHWREIFTYSSKTISSGIANFIISEGDTLFIGKILGSYTLGIYNLSWRASNLVSRNIVSLVNKISFPYIAKSADDLKEVLFKINKIFRILSLITFPLIFLLIVLADDFILGVYGSQWKVSILPFQIFLIHAVRYSVGAPIGFVFNSLGRPDINLKIQLSLIPFYILAIFFGSSYGIIGVAIGVTFIRTIFGFLSFFILAKILQTSVITFFKQMQYSFFAALISSLIVLFTRESFLLRFDLHHILSFFILFILGILFYVLIIKVFFRKTSNEIEGIIKKLL